MDPKMLTKACDAVARNLVDFGYRDVTGAMIREIYDAMKAGKPLPHGVIGKFAESQIRDHPQYFGEFA